MNDRHLNLFHTYGRAARWEDNFTRAFLITLQNLAPVHFRLFLRDVLLAGENQQELQDRIDLRAAGQPHFDLQVSGSSQDAEDTLTSETGVLVTIDTTGAEEVSLENASAEGGARVDAVVTDPDADVTAVIEVKVGSEQSSAQLATHHAAFFNPEESNPGDVHVNLKWEDVLEYLDTLHRQSVSNRENYVLGEFVEYADRLGLAPFRGFRKRDFNERRERPLRKLLQVVTARHGDELGMNVGSSSAHRLDFDEISENIWIGYVTSPPSTLRVSVVGGADGIWHARQFWKAFDRNPHDFREVGDRLLEGLGSGSADLDVTWEPKNRYYVNRGNQPTRGSRRFSHPDEFNGFVDRMLDETLNPREWIPGTEMDTRFGDELDIPQVPSDQDDGFPPWEDDDEILVYTFFHLEVLIPSGTLIELGREPTIEMVTDQLRLLRESAVRLKELKNAV